MAPKCPFCAILSVRASVHVPARARARAPGPPRTAPAYAAPAPARGPSRRTWREGGREEGRGASARGRHLTLRRRCLTQPGVGSGASPPFWALRRSCSDWSSESCSSGSVPCSYRRCGYRCGGTSHGCGSGSGRNSSPVIAPTRRAPAARADAPPPLLPAAPAPPPPPSPGTAAPHAAPPPAPPATATVATSSSAHAGARTGALSGMKGGKEELQEPAVP